MAATLYRLGKVSSSGNSATVQQYDFIDPTPLNGTGYYRLKLVDLDSGYLVAGNRGN